MDASSPSASRASPSELDAYRLEADRFLSAIEDETYRHYAGLKDRLELEPIYERHAELTELERVRAIGAAVEDGPGVRELWRFACQTHLSGLTRAQEERIAAAEAELTATIDGRTIPFRMLEPEIANEPDRAVRERMDERRRTLLDEHLNPLYIESAALVRQAVPQLGAPTYLDLHRAFGLALDRLADECRELLDETRSLWETAGDRLFRTRVGVALAEAKRWDVARAFRAPQWDSSFPRDRMLPALEATLTDLGIELGRQENIALDVEQRPTKTPRAYCFPIEVPGRIVLMIQPQGGPWDWHSLFHEAGHSEHFAHMAPDLGFEHRRLGDDAVTEGWAFLFDHLVAEPAWLRRRLDVPRPDEYAAESAAELLYFVRRYAAKLLYELELHSTSGDVEALRPRYVELLGDALGIEPPAENFLADVDSGFYVSAYLRAWAVEAQLQWFFREELGNEWFRRRVAGSLLRELWSLGQKPTADELLRDLMGAPVELSAIAERIRERLPS
jgi:hypothetical protein